jgi:hypothetical protein
MSSILEMVTGQLGGDMLKNVSGLLGSDEKKTGTAVAAAVPLLLGALARNSANTKGAESLAGALDKDHDGSILDNVAGFLGQAQAGPGEGILRHVLGARRPAVEAGLSKSSGLDVGSVGKLLTMVAPLVMGALGRTKREKGMDPGTLGNFLGQERQAIEQKAPQEMGLLGALLDADGDGDVDLSDIAKRGGGLLGKLFGGK